MRVRQDVARDGAMQERRGIPGSRLGRLPVIVLTLATLLALVAPVASQAQLSVSESGLPVYSMPIGVPPGTVGMSPNMALMHGGIDLNGPLGVGWSLQGISLITRCPNINAVDGVSRGVDYTAADKLCLDGQRLIQTDAAGSPAAFPQTNDSLGGTGLVREYRTEKDSFVRVRAYGTAGGVAANGPAYFKVWTKGGQIYEYGNNANSTANSAIAVQGKTAISAWAVSRISDTLSNYIDFQYEQRDVAWGSGPTAPVSPTPGHEWNLLEIRYTGTATQLATSRVVFSYSDRPDNGNSAQDRSEAYNQGAKNVSIRRLDAIRTYVNWPASQATVANPAAPVVKVKTTRLTYEQGPITKRSRITKIQECVGAAETQCSPPTTFTYTPGGDDSFTRSTAFNLTTEALTATAGNYGVVTGDFNGDGTTDILRWSDTSAQNKLWLGSQAGTFNLVPNGTALGQFNLIDQTLRSANGCMQLLAADLDGDGLTDLLRFMPGVAGCSAPSHAVFLSKGDGSFTFLPGAYPGIPLNQWPVNFFSSGIGANFYLLDVNNDGRLDIVSTILPRYTGTFPGDATLCVATVCTRIYLGQVGGTFTELTTTNIANRSAYTDYRTQALRQPAIQDLNGDGIADLNVDSGVWLSRGDGNFDIGGLAGVGCALAIDVNADGRMDCVTRSSTASQQKLSVSVSTTTLANAANFNLITAGQELQSVDGSSDVIALDGYDGGKGALLRTSIDPTKNALFVSNGEGTFRQSATFNLNTAITPLRNSVDKTSEFTLGDFTGQGQIQILRLKANPTAASEGTGNQLYVRTNAVPADLLSTVTSGTGLVTTLTWVALSNSAGVRYKSDRGVAGRAAVFPRVDLSPPSYVVATMTSQTGVGSATVATEYSYAGLKAARDGRGLQGFRETRQQRLGANGQPLTVVTQYLQDYPYSGVASKTETYLGYLDTLSSKPISSSTYTYCDKSAATGAETTATPTAPCPPGATKIYKPYLYKSVDAGAEFNAAADNGGADLPSVTTLNSFNNSGDPTAISVTTSGVALGVSQTFTKTTSNVYAADLTTGDSWILGRLTNASQTNSSPSALGLITTAAGGAPYAAATQGTPYSVALSTPAFTNTLLGQSSTATAILTNSGSVSSLPLTVPSAASVSGADFSFASTTCGSTLAAASSCAVTIAFTPTQRTLRSGTLSLVTGAGASTASLSATGLGSVATVVSGDWIFGNVSAGAAAPERVVSLRNDGNSQMTITGLSNLPAALSATSNSCISVAPTAACAITLQLATATVVSFGQTVATIGATANTSINVSGAVVPALPVVTISPSAINRPVPTRAIGNGVYITVVETATAFVSGGAAPYTYSWQRISGSISLKSPTNTAAGSFTATLPRNAGASSVFRVTATDSTGQVGTSNITVNYIPY